ncbi:xanthine dehydrogenase small subunit [Caulobacter flavus]|uniref:Xanthine dehydrogenase small subunit n=1 Tax=Caulobacter flavus TaxID=1679497 RepID=A0A2N5CUU6_9CAUL|nr:xanthine dehydrogenase small subunit [Caulobacter flavus]AYV45040.1 xanthine dehydrogenase small subunit [Caulobacter flavus]PLR17308.1 xanthine dehydrogenase small subunit [Caulobacter flavus]
MGGTIRFLLDGEVREAAGVDPTTTLLEHLRGPLRRTGTKEGCAEGDCGSCTVLVGELTTGDDLDPVNWRAVNACIQFLPMLDGKAVMTVESLAVGDVAGCKGKPHPVQQALIDRHGSQCGFCTPGIVMSLYGRAVGACGAGAAVEDVLAGNLCRCTGYGPILDAARAVTREAAPDVAAPLRAIQRETMLSLAHEDPVRGVTRRWLAPRGLAELAAAAEANPDAAFVAGATDVGLWVTKLRKPPQTLIDIGRMPELKTIGRVGDALRIGAGVRYVEAIETLSARHPGLADMMRRLGSTQVRNSGTIGGNIANGSPIGDMPPALIALGAVLVLRRGEQVREMPLEDFFVAYGQQDRQPGEFVEAVIVPRGPDGQIFKVYKLSKRFDQDISAVCGAFAITVVDGVVIEARVAFGGMAGTPSRAGACEAALIGAPWTRESVEAAAAKLDEDYTPLSDMRASAAYRATTARNLLIRAFLESAQPGVATSVLAEAAHG